MGEQRPWHLAHNAAPASRLRQVFARAVATVACSRGIDLRVQPRRTPLDTAQHQVLDCIEADQAMGERLSNCGVDVLEPEHLQQAQDLDEFALARLAQPRFEQPAQVVNSSGSCHTTSGEALVERADLPF